jgi:hypothetical protein
MARFLSVLLLLAGLGAAAYGALGMSSRSPAAMDASAPADSAPDGAVQETPPIDPAASGPAEAPADPDVLPAAEPKPGVIDDLLRKMPAPPSGTFDTGDAAPPETPVSSERSAAEDFLFKLKTVPVAHETPATAEYKRAFDVTFAIDATGDATAADALPGRGVVETGEARVTERVSVRLSGAAFKIDSASPDTQVLSPVTENVWRWRATPLSAGTHDLTFEVFAIDQEDVTPLRTYSDRVTVKVSGMSAAVAFADRVNPLFVLLGGLGSALAGAFGVARFFMKK